MLDSENLRTASLYINNQLLSRGLLRDGRSIAFADPGATEYDLADTMGRIMGVVNDLILRRDRDAEHRESLSATLRTLRADSLRQSDNFSRLQDRYAESQRKLALADAAEAARAAQLKAAEATVHKLKDDAARAKKLVAETRAVCANEVRKRDRQIEALRRAAAEAGRARGERKSAGLTTIHITGELGVDDTAAAAAAAASTMEDGYSLRHETNGFLAQLAKGLSEENDALVTLVRKTKDSLQEISGFGKDEEGGDQAAEADKPKVDHHAASTKVLSASPEQLTTDLDSVVTHVRTILSNPSFAPLEEVLVREEEIFRLRDGWEKMETRWREAVHLIDGWRRRMAANGQPVNMEELKLGLRLSPVKVPNIDGTGHTTRVFNLSTLDEEDEEEEEKEEEAEAEDKGQNIFEQQPGSPSPAGSLHLVPAPDFEEQDDSDQSSIFEDDVDIDMDELQDSEPNVEILQQSAGDPLEESTSLVLPPPPKITLLEETNTARNRKLPLKAPEKSRKRPGASIEDETDELGSDVPPPPPPHKSKPQHSPQKRLKLSTGADDDKSSSRPTSELYTNSNSSLDSILLSKPSSESSARSTRSTTAASKKETAPVTKAAVKGVKAVAQEKKDTPPKTITRTRSTRAATTSRSAPTKPDPPPPSSTRSRPTRSNTTPKAEIMAPPPRPKKRTANNTTSSSTQATTPAAKPLPPPPPSSSSRLPLPRNVLAAPQQSPVTVAAITAKLAASEREANAARVRAKIKAARLAKSGAAAGVGAVAVGDPLKKPTREVSGTSSVSLDENGRTGGVSIAEEKAEEEEEEKKPAVSNKAARSKSRSREEEQHEQQETPRRAVPAAAAGVNNNSPAKATTIKRKREVRSRADKVASRRRSTLSPWELQSLITGDVVPPTPQ